MSTLTPEQVKALLSPIKPHRVGRDKKGLSHVEAYEIRAHLNRLFGFARWSAETVAMEPIDEKFATITKDGKPKDVVTVAYRAQLRLTVCAQDGTPLATYTEWATGDAPNFPAHQWPDAHDFALKTAESQALKRCAANLGDQFGLSLYRDGSVSALVGVTFADGTLVRAGDDGPADAQDAAPPTHRPPDPQPKNVPEAETQGEGVKAQGTPPEDGKPPSSSGGPPPHEFYAGSPGGPCRECDGPKDAAWHIEPDAEWFRDALLAETSKERIKALYRRALMRNFGDTEVADAKGVAVKLEDLAQQRLKETT